MKRTAFAILMFAAFQVAAQGDNPGPPPGPGLKWVQVRSMAQNHSCSEWRIMADSVPDYAFLPHVTIYVHDTVYLPAKDTSHKSTAGDSVSSGMTWYSRTGDYAEVSASWGLLTRASKRGHVRRFRTPKKKRKPIPKDYFSACDAKPIYGLIVYKDWSTGYVGVRADSGYWVGCGTQFIQLPNDRYMIPGRCKRVIEGRSPTTWEPVPQLEQYYSGKFFTSEGKQIDNARVFELIF